MLKVTIANYLIHNLANRPFIREGLVSELELIAAVVDQWSAKQYLSEPVHHIFVNDTVNSQKTTIH